MSEVYFLFLTIYVDDEGVFLQADVIAHLSHRKNMRHVLLSSSVFSLVALLACNKEMHFYDRIMKEKIAPKIVQAFSSATEKHIATIVAQTAKE